VTFREILAQVIEWLQQDKRISYRALKRQFNLDDEYLEDLKLEIVKVRQLAVEQDGQMLLWTGNPSSPELDARRVKDVENRFHAMLRAVVWTLQRERRTTYRELKHVLGLDDALLMEIREELTFKQFARDEEGKGLVWTGMAQPVTHSSVDVTSQPVTAETTVVQSPAVPTSPLPTETLTPSNGPTILTEAISVEALQDKPAVAPEPVPSAPEAERRQLTVMFCDLADSTKLSQQLDPEDLREVVRAYQATAAEIIQQYDGHMAQYLGDGLLIYFGWPIAHEDDVQRSLHAGLGIVEAITTTLNPRLEQEKGIQLTVRLGVHTGPVVVGEMGGGGRHENLATGETVNIASRLEGLATPNTVVISEVTSHLIQDAFVLEGLGPHELKGVAEPMQVFRVDSLRAVDAEDTATGGFESLVGRDEEIGLLLRRWGQSKEGLGQVVLISGEAGIGKSSLVEGLRQHVRQEGVTRIIFRCSEYVQQSTLYPVIEHLHRVLGWQRGDDAKTRLVKLERMLEPLGLPLEETVPLVAALLSLSLPENRYPALTLLPQEQRQQTQDVLVAWLLEEAERQPVLMVWEDLHWADPSSVELLGLFIDQVPTVSMLQVLVFRPTFVPSWPTQSHMTPLTLNRLERPQVEAMITRLAGGKTLPTEVVEHIVAKTDGVPLYVEELTKMLLESAFLQEEAEQYTLTAPLEEAAIPATLSGFADGAVGPVTKRAGGGPIGRGVGSGVCLRDAASAVRRGRNGAKGGAQAIGGQRVAVPSGETAPGHLHLSSRPDPGYRIPVAFAAYASALSRASGAAVGSTVSRGGRDTTGARGVSLYQGQPRRAGHWLLAAGRSTGERALRVPGGNKPLDNRPHPASDPAGDPGASSAGTAAADSAWGSITYAQRAHGFRSGIRLHAGS